MFATLHCIALRTVRYSDSRSIVSAWSAERGYVAFAMPAGNGREARRRRALTMPLSVFEGEVDIKPGHDMLSMRDLKASKVNIGVASDPAKLAVALFLAETLERLLRDSQPDHGLWNFIAESVDALNLLSGRATANFHLWFLYRLTALMGLEPDTATWSRDACFDMRGGRWTATPPLSGEWLSADDARGVHTLSRLTLRNISLIRLSRDQRNAMTDGILRYLSIHVGRLGPMQSLDIVRELF